MDADLLVFAVAFIGFYGYLVVKIARGWRSLEGASDRTKKVAAVFFIGGLIGTLSYVLLAVIVLFPVPPRTTIYGGVVPLVAVGGALMVYAWSRGRRDAAWQQFYGRWFRSRTGRVSLP